MYPLKDADDTADRYMEKMEELIRLKDKSVPTRVSNSPLSNETSQKRSVSALRQ